MENCELSSSQQLYRFGQSRVLYLYLERLENAESSSVSSGEQSLEHMCFSLSGLILNV